jgi:hypothetical protein
MDAGNGSRARRPELRWAGERSSSRAVGHGRALRLPAGMVGRSGRRLLGAGSGIQSSVGGPCRWPDVGHRRLSLGTWRGTRALCGTRVARNPYRWVLHSESRRQFRRLHYKLGPVLLMLASGCDDKDHGDDLNGAGPNEGAENRSRLRHRAPSRPSGLRPGRDCRHLIDPHSPRHDHQKPLVLAAPWRRARSDRIGHELGLGRSPRNRGPTLI